MNAQELSDRITGSPRWDWEGAIGASFLTSTRDSVPDNGKTILQSTPHSNEVLLLSMQDDQTCVVVSKRALPYFTQTKHSQFEIPTKHLRLNLDSSTTRGVLATVLEELCGAHLEGDPIHFMAGPALAEAILVAFGDV